MIIQHDFGNLPLLFNHGFERDRLGGVGHADDNPRVLLREKAFGHDYVEPDRSDQSRERHRKGETLMPEYPDQPAFVGVNHSAEKFFGEVIESSVFFFGFGTQ